jgi:hypothetical protein
MVLEAAETPPRGVLPVPSTLGPAAGDAESRSVAAYAEMREEDANKEPSSATSPKARKLSLIFIFASRGFAQT